MKNIFLKISCLVLLCFCMTIVLPDVCTVKAAPAMTAQQKAKAKAKKKKEAEKAKKAREKAKAQKAKAKQKPSKSSGKTSAASQKQSREEIYLQQVEEINAYNERASRYNARDIDHRLGFYGQVGYSALLPAKFSYDATTQVGFNEAAKGYVGGGGGFGYQLRYQRLLFNIGAEFQMYNTINALYGADRKANTFAAEYGVQGISGMTYHYDFNKAQDMIKAAYVQIPVLFGMEFAQNQYYFLAGAKVGINMLGTSTFSSALNTYITDREAIDPLTSMPTHIVGDYPIASNPAKLKFGLNVAAYAEIGICLDRFIDKLSATAFRPRVALFAEYGFLNIQQKSNVTNSWALPVDFTSVVDRAGHPVNDLACSSSLQTASAASATLNPLMVGAKVSFYFNLPRQTKQLLKLPSEPNPELAAIVTDMDNGQALQGAQVTITDRRSGKEVLLTSNRMGLVKRRTAKGDYFLTAEKPGFYHGDTIAYTLRSMTDGGRDTVILALRKEPVPIIYTYCARIYAGDTGMPVEANVTVKSAKDSTTLYEGQSADDGLFVTNLLQGDYITHIHFPGYMDQTELAHFEQDTLEFYLTKIKEGVRVRIDNLRFATAKTVILPESEQAMATLAQFLADNPSVSILIIGHTDNVGKARANQILSEGRAQAVRRDLIQRGIAADRIKAEGRGMTEPVADNDTEEGRALNRRVEFMILDTQGEDIQIFNH